MGVQYDAKQLKIACEFGNVPDFTLDELVERINSDIKRSVQGPIVLVGYSMGGLIAR